VQCSSSADCSGTSTPACLQNRCVQCAISGDCPSGMPYCATGGDSPGRCVQCVQSAQCPPNAPSCNSGTCGKSGN
jgi:Cys-rich repeat protein